MLRKGISAVHLSYQGRRRRHCSKGLQTKRKRPTGTRTKKDFLLNAHHPNRWADNNKKEVCAMNVSTSPVRVAVVQFDPQVGTQNRPANLNTSLSLALEAVNNGANLIVLPELANTGYLSSLLGVLVWRQQWRKRGWYPTYVPLVSVVPAVVLAYGGSMTVIVSSALLGALVAPPLACSIAGRLPSYLHPYIGNVLSMAISTVLIVPTIGYWLAQ
ncbi:nitrilase-related carbon-nitrogen hydrolase [Pseudomonas sp. H2_H03]